MKTVNVAVATVAQSFPASTVVEKFVFSLVGVSGEVATQSVDVPIASFPDVADGVYTVEVSRNGVKVASAEFTIVADTISIDVPSSVSVTLV